MTLGALFAQCGRSAPLRSTSTRGSRRKATVGYLDGPS